MSAVTGSPTPRIRPAQAADAPALAALLGELGFANRAADLLSRLERMQGEDEDAVLVAERDTAVVGLVVLHRMHVLHRPAPVGRITAFVIAEAVRG